MSDPLNGAIWRVEQADCIKFMDALPADSVSLIVGSPPYADARTYGINAIYGCQEWVDFMLRVTTAAVRVCRGLVLWVVAGVQRDNCYWPGPEGLCWEWWKRGNQLWCPAVWWKVDENDGGTGIPGSGGNVPGKRWLRKDWEYVLCFKKEGNIPYDHPEEMGHEPIYSRLGGSMSNRMVDGRRANDPWGKHGRGNNLGGRTRDGKKNPGTTHPGKMPPGPVHDAEGNIVRANGRPFPKIANPGNVLPLIVKARVGGGYIGNRIAHSNEAPFPERLCEFFIRSYSPPGGICLDPFCGSGTTLAVAVREGRHALGCDLRAEMVELTRRRVSGETPTLFPET